MRDTAADPVSAAQAFADEVLRGMASLHAAERAGGRPDPVLQPGELTIPLGLSAWIERAAIGLPDAFGVLLNVRAVVVVAAGLPGDEEPVPLRVADHAVALRSLGTYLFELFGRAVRVCGAEPIELAERALDIYLGRV